ncbi:hypothetical protein GUITHDRAFT_114968 [Guillardia theta CCMP2712]|uniref:Uncharacterized protein n=1 Tax=Guillardia theta (strain CCMP2712) TaxID=905079 RepID=L1IRK4_GUITC|nr:hypothetical protein GUITHDRAFT_114968 [Guillardia theta CCMP2712]EKX38863.1 hypothetical protein GUITHDRAFT_114968 [Guillardia theta CCMP2712]|eukprot:XP_005825843.1 hypothetical protein GUITHDRAFT_114968 [Guillardia theta CCMP2712]
MALSAAAITVREEWNQQRWSLDSPYPNNCSTHLRDRQSSQSKTLFLTALGGAIGAGIRSKLKEIPTAFAQQPWKHLIVHGIGAFLLGLFSHPVFPKDVFALLVAAFRTVSAIVTVDVYNCVASGNQLLAWFYLCTSLPANLLMNHVGRTIAALFQRLACTLADLS